MSGHTPGPWAIDGNAWVPWEGAIGIVNPNSAHHIAWTTSGELVPAEANARLIAASPRMYDYIKLRAEAGDSEAQDILEDIHAAR